MTGLPLLSLLVWLPLAGAVVLMFAGREQKSLPRAVATVVMAVQVVLALAAWAGFGDGPGFRYVERFEWLPSVGVTYHLGIDGLGLTLVALSAVIGLIAAVASYGIQDRVRDFYLYLLLLQTGIMGVFTALDYILFFIFWELMLVPMYFLIGIWGHDRREYAAIKFFVYTMVGSMIMLVSILALYFATGAGTFDMLAIAEAAPALPLAVQRLIFLGLFAGFAVKVPVVPLHTWLPDAHVEAPTPISVILAAVLLKAGGYAFFRISLPTLPEAAAAFGYFFAVLGIINIVWGALVALAQTDFKRVVAYSSVSHMGFVMLGLGAAALPAVSGAAEALTGAAYVMLAHGLNSALLFLLVGVYYDRLHTRDLNAMGGLFKAMPFAGTVLAWAIFANLGLPGLSGFIGEFFTFLGAYRTVPGLVYVGLVGLVLVTAFNLWTLHRVNFGPPNERYGHLSDMTARETLTLVPLVALTTLLGVYPGFVFDVLNQPVTTLLQRLAAGF
ncbi:MAG: NADH-quinone oxidoreductase subunit M [Bacillota bacterium]|nr:NADH-quinone oxidoreductase subunit M [Bacillota bacterium]REJ37797.1 MAG: NADH-quinone oxidoreductase subunit M [Bacillota bacterium]